MLAGENYRLLRIGPIFGAVRKDQMSAKNDARVEVSIEDRAELAAIGKIIQQLESRAAEILHPYMVQVGKNGAGAALKRANPAAKGRVLFETDDGGCYEDPPGWSLVCPTS